jgi:acyl carrier protein
MDLTPLIDELADLLDAKPSELNDQVELASFANWDSLTKVTLIGFLLDQFEVAIDPERIDALRTVGDLFQAVREPALTTSS